MSSRTGNWMIALGVVVLLMGVLVLPAALGEHPDTSLIALGACGVSLGSMIAALGIYVKARALQSPDAPGAPSGETKSSTRRVRGGCDVCHGEPAQHPQEFSQDGQEYRQGTRRLTRPGPSWMAKVTTVFPARYVTQDSCRRLLWCVDPFLTRP